MLGLVTRFLGVAINDSRVTAFAKEVERQLETGRFPSGNRSEPPVIAVAACNSDMGVGSVVGDVGGKLIIKIKDGKLAAVLQEASLDANVSGMTMAGSAGMGLVYTVGGQSVTLPAV